MIKYILIANLPQKIKYFKHVVKQWYCKSTRWLEETSKHVSVPSNTNSWLHFFLTTLTFHRASKRPCCKQADFSGPLADRFSGPSQGPKKASERPFRAPTLTVVACTLVVEALEAPQYYQMQHCYWLGADKGFQVETCKIPTNDDESQFLHFCLLFWTQSQDMCLWRF